MKMPFRKRGKNAGLPLRTAEQMLSNVFIACGREPNSVPLEALSSYSNYRKERYTLQRSVIVVVLVLFMLLPVLFFAAEIRITQDNPHSEANPVYTVSVSSRIPIGRIRAELGGRNVPIYEISANEYRIQPRGNGEMNISVALLNRQITSCDFTVSDVDVEQPQLISSETDDDCIYLYVSDAQSGVDYAAVTIADADGSLSAPISWNADAGCIVLAYPAQVQTVRIPDLRGNVLRVQLKPQA